MNPAVGQLPVLLTIEELCAIVRVSKRTIFRMKKSGQLPAPVKVRRGTRWRAEDIQQWIADGGSTSTAQDSQEDAQ